MNYLIVCMLFCAISVGDGAPVQTIGRLSELLLRFLQQELGDLDQDDTTIPESTTTTPEPTTTTEEPMVKTMPGQPMTVTINCSPFCVRNQYTGIFKIKKCADKKRQSGVCLFCRVTLNCMTNSHIFS